MQTTSFHELPRVLLSCVKFTLGHMLCLAAHANAEISSSRHPSAAAWQNPKGGKDSERCCAESFMYLPKLPATGSYPLKTLQPLCGRQKGLLRNRECRRTYAWAAESAGRWILEDRFSAASIFQGLHMYWQSAERGDLYLL